MGRLAKKATEMQLTLSRTASHDKLKGNGHLTESKQTGNWHLAELHLMISWKTTDCCRKVNRKAT